jgi:hypothetical protein
MRPSLLPVVVLVTIAAVCGCGSGSTDGGGPGSSTTMTGGDQNFPSTGNSYVDARRCPACHQSQNPQQDGFMAGTSQPITGSWGNGINLYGPNLTPDPNTGIGNWDDDQITNAIMNGVDAQGERLCPEMQHFPDMQQDELQSILGYLHSLAPVVHQVQVSSCPPLKP